MFSLCIQEIIITQQYQQTQEAELRATCSSLEQKLEQLTADMKLQEQIHEEESQTYLNYIRALRSQEQDLQQSLSQEIESSSSILSVFARAPPPEWNILDLEDIRKQSAFVPSSRPHRDLIESDEQILHEGALLNTLFDGMQQENHQLSQLQVALQSELASTVARLQHDFEVEGIKNQNERQSLQIDEGCLHSGSSSGAIRK